MKSIISFVLILSFLGIAVFGFLGIGAESEHGHGICLASIAEGKSPCPKTNPFSFAIFHINAYKNFSLAVIALLVIISFGFLALGVLGPEVTLGLNNRVLLEKLSFAPTPTKIALTHWLALHENSPTFS